VSIIPAVLRILAGVSIALLLYEAWTLLTGVLLPLLGNPNIIQTDFHYYYEAAVRFRGDASQLYRLSDDVIAGFTYPPPAILPFVVLSFAPLGVAMLVLTVSSYLGLAACIVLWLRYLAARGLVFERTDAAAAGIVAIALGPTYSNAIFGQVNAWVLVCAVVFVAVGPVRPVTGGMFIAAGALLKIYPVLMGAIGLWNRAAWRSIAYAGAAALAIIIVGLPIVPADSYVTFLGEVLPSRFDKTAVHISNQSLIAFIERFSIPPERFLNWTGEQAIAASGTVRAFNWLFGIAVIAWLWRRAINGRQLEEAGSAAGLIALAAAIAPLGWGHTYMLVLPLVILHLVALPNASRISTAMVCACVAALMIPAGRRFEWLDALPAILQNVFYSRYLLVTLFLIALPPVTVRR
jgi:alpha-1,2-mannosyltransferase